MQNFLRRKKGPNCPIQMHNFSCTKFLKFLYNSFLKGDFDDCVMWFLLTFFHIFLTNILRLSSSCGIIFLNAKNFSPMTELFNNVGRKILGRVGNSVANISIASTNTLPREHGFLLILLLLRQVQKSNRELSQNWVFGGFLP